MPVVWLMLRSSWWIPSYCNLIRYWVNRSEVQQPDAAVCLWHFPLTFPVTPPWNSSSMAHSPLLRAKLRPPRPIFRRKLFFIAPKTLRLSPVWPRPPRSGLQVVRSSFLLPIRGQLRGQAFKKSRSQPGLQSPATLGLPRLCSLHRTRLGCILS